MLHGYPHEDALAEVCTDAEAILARLGIVTRRVIEAAPRLRIIARHGAGSDGVDLEAATSRGVVVTTTGPANAGAVAEYTFALLLGLFRKVVAADRGMREGAWDRAPLVGEALEGKTIGIIGLGAVGARVARIAAGFGMHPIAAASPFRPQPPGPVPLLPLPDLLAASDIVTLHGRLTPQTERSIDAQTFASMQPGAVLVNTARGELVDESALLAALLSGRLAGAALDTYATEPLAPNSPLRSLPNVILSPHVAGQTTDAVLRVGLAAADAILAELNGQRPPYTVNPEAYAARKCYSVPT